MYFNQEAQYLFDDNVALLPTTTKPRFARVKATFIRLGSVTNPSRLSSLQRTVVNTITCHLSLEIRMQAVKTMFCVLRAFF